MKKIVFALFFIMIWGASIGQGKFVDEYEVTVGYSVFQGDYGEKGDFSSNLGNSGFLLGGKAYMNFLNYNMANCYACKHLKFPLIFNVGYSNLSFSQAYNNSDLTPDLIKLKAFSGSIFQSHIGLGVEYHIGDLNAFSFGSNNFLETFDPFIGGSIGVTAYVVRLKSSLGDYNTNPNVLPTAFRNGVYDKPGVVPTFAFEGGFRYKLNNNFSITLNSRWIYYLSDKVDGLVPDSSLVDNDHNDWQFSPSIGVVFLLKNGGFY